MALIKCEECGKDVSNKATSCPHCGAPIGKVSQTPAQSPKKKPSKLKTIGAWVLAFFVIMIVIAAFNEDEKGTGSQSSRSGSAQRASYVFSAKELAVFDALLKEDIKVFSAGGLSVLLHSINATEVSASGLFNDYRKNEVAADQSYKGRILIVTGKVESINKDFTDKPYLSLAAGGYLRDVHASFAKGTNEQRIANISKNQNITLMCEGNGMVLGTPMLRNCRFLDTVAAEEESKVRAEFQRLQRAGGKASEYVMYIASGAIAITPFLSESTKCGVDAAACAAEVKSIDNGVTKGLVGEASNKLREAGWSF